MARVFGGLRSSNKAARQTEEKSIAFSRYYHDLARRGGSGTRFGANWSIERAVTQGYERVIWVFKSVNVLAADSSGLPYRLRQGDDVVDDHPLYRVLNGKANPLESGKVLRKRLSAQVCLSPRGAFVERVVSNAGTVRELHLLPPDRVEVIPGLTSLVDHYRFTRHNGTVKNLEPDQVMWFRDPHPTDPYRASTALEAAGMSVELDHFARLYNVSFMQNDGRPGGVLAVRATDGTTGDVDEKAMNRIESRFEKGPTEAGKLSVIAGQIEYIDLATRPRDLQYGTMSANAKAELLAAFGMSEVVLGQASGRTYSNAEAELYNYWTRTIPAHNDILLDGFDEDAGDDLVGFFDTSKIEVLERAEKERREEMRSEVAAGYRSIWSYAQAAGYGDEIEDNIFTRSLYIPNGRTPIPTRQGDAEILGLDAEGGGGSPKGVENAALDQADREQAGGRAGEQVDEIVTAEQVNTPSAPSAPMEPGLDVSPPGLDMAALGVTQAKRHPGLLSIEQRAGGGRRPKGHLTLALKSAGEWSNSEASEDVYDDLEQQLSEVLTTLAERWVARATARANGPRQRKGTRHWSPEFAHDTRVGVKALDASRVVDEETWASETEERVSPLLTAALTLVALNMLSDLDFTPSGNQTLRQVATGIATGVAEQALRLLGRSVRRQARLLAGLVNRADQDGSPIEEIQQTIREYIERMRRWASGVSVVLANGAVNEARDTAATAVLDAEPLREIQREWISRRDERVRPEHVVADGQIRGVGEAFLVGGFLLRHPGDLTGPPHLVAGCRCRLRHRHRRTGRFASAPPMAPTA